MSRCASWLRLDISAPIFSFIKSKAARKTRHGRDGEDKQRQRPTEAALHRVSVTKHTDIVFGRHVSRLLRRQFEI